MKKNVIKSICLFVITLSVLAAAGAVVNHYDKAREVMSVVSERVLVPGGQSVGIKMDVKGVLIVGLEEIETENQIVSPGYDAGIQIGDMIISINGIPVYYAQDVADIINGRNEQNISSPLLVKILRKEEEMNVEVLPVKDKNTKKYKVGLWVKEKIAGIGTLTFYDPKTNSFAALGHGIYETKTGTLLDAGEGQLLKTEVKSIKEGEEGKPGEIRGIFYGGENPLGDVLKNSKFGIYSKGTDLSIFKESKPMVLGYPSQVKEGDAYILTTINGNKVESFDIKITKVNRQAKADSKSMEIKVTDDRLLQYCGGIVQGMSGSPIIQNNRIVGAVTHVFINNPTRGYGIFAEWMVDECEKI